MKPLIQKLVETHGPSGFENQVREIVRAEVESLVDQVRVDNLGNLIAQIGEKTNSESKGLRIMLVAHMDEIGVIATHIDDNGFVRFMPIGGLRRLTCLGGRVRFLNGTSGVIGAERPADASYSDWSKAPTFDRMFIDVGATSRQKCPVHVGDVAAFERPFLDLGKRLVAKALDNRVGVAILIETLRQMKTRQMGTPHQLFFVFSAQEEVGPRGATTAAYAIDPDLGLALDVTGSGDTPKGMRMEVRLGEGPAIKIRDRGNLSDPRVVRWMVDTAQRERLPHQMEVLELGGTEARVIQVARAGVLAGSLSIPARYVHTPSEMVDYDDVQNAVKLMLALLCNPVELE